MCFKNNYYYLWKKKSYFLNTEEKVIEHIFRLDCDYWKENAFLK